MKNFLRDHSYTSMIVLVNQIAIAIVGMTLSLACSMAGNDTLRIICSVFATVFYLFLVYTKVWDIGAKDSVSVEYGHKEYKPWTGLWIGLLAAVPNFILAIGTMLVFLLPNSSFFGNLGASCKMIALFAEGMYSGLLALRIGNTHLNSYWISFFIIPLPAILTCAAAYYFGLKEKKFTRLFELQHGTGKKNKK